MKRRGSLTGGDRRTNRTSNRRAWTQHGSLLLLGLLGCSACDAVLVDPAPSDSGLTAHFSFSEVGSSPWADSALTAMMSNVGEVRLRFFRGDHSRDTVVRGRIDDGELRVRIRLDPAEVSEDLRVDARLVMDSGAPLFAGRGRLRVEDVAPSARMEVTPYLVTYATRYGQDLVISSLDGSLRSVVRRRWSVHGVDASATGEIVYARFMVREGLRIYIEGHLFSDWLTGPEVEEVLDEQQWPRFSADGRWIYFMGEAAEGWELWRVRPDGTEAGRLEQPDRPFNGYPAPSRGGDRIVYSAWDESLTGSSGVLEILDLNSGVARPLNVHGETARWSPDDRWIAYQNQEGQLRLVRPDGSEDHELAPGWEFRSGFDWSSDGRYIIGASPDGEAILLTLASSEAMTVSLEGLGSGGVETIAWYGAQKITADGGDQ